jgi:hypothetical protein
VCLFVGNIYELAPDIVGGRDSPKKKTKTTAGA